MSVSQSGSSVKLMPVLGSLLDVTEPLKETCVRVGTRRVCVVRHECVAWALNGQRQASRGVIPGRGKPPP